MKPRALFVSNCPSETRWDPRIDSDRSSTIELSPMSRHPQTLTVHWDFSGNSNNKEDSPNKTCQTHVGSWLIFNPLWILKRTSLKKVSRWASICWHLSNTSCMSSMYLGLYELISCKAASYFSLVRCTSSLARWTRSCSLRTWEECWQRERESQTHHDDKNTPTIK